MVQIITFSNENKSEQTAVRAANDWLEKRGGVEVLQMDTSASMASDSEYGMLAMYYITIMYRVDD